MKKPLEMRVAEGCYGPPRSENTKLKATAIKSMSLTVRIVLVIYETITVLSAADQLL